MTTKLTMMPAVMAMDAQRWVWRIHLLQFKETSSRDEPEVDWVHLPQLTAFFTSAAIFASSAAVNSFSAKEVGHTAVVT